MTPTFQAGDLKHLVEIIGQEEEPDGQGGFEVNDVVEEERFASIEPISTAEKAEYQATDMEITHRITMRPPKISSDKKICFTDRDNKERVFEITGIRDLKEERRKIEIEAKEIEGGHR